jgi:hypothetical protein
MSWSSGITDNLEPEPKVEQAAPEPFVVTREMRHAVVGEIQQHVLNHLPLQYAWIVKMTLLDYGCRALVAEPEENEVTFEPTWNEGV